MSTFKGAPKEGGGGYQVAAPSNRKKDSVDTMIRNVLLDLPFSRNQPLKQTDH